MHEALLTLFCFQTEVEASLAKMNALVASANSNQISRNGGF